MRRAILFMAMMSAVLLAAGPVAASVTTFRYSVTGSGAFAFASNGGDNWFEGLYVEISEAAIRADGTTSTSNAVYVDHYRETCDRHGCVGEDTFAWAGDVPFTIDSKLLFASVDATMPGIHCSWDRHGSTCEEVSVEVSVTWTASGPLIRSHGTNSSGVPGEFQYTSSGTGMQRTATAAGVAAGFDLSAATDLGATIYSQKYGERAVSHTIGG